MEMASLNSVGAETTDSIFTELARSPAASWAPSGGMDFARGVIERALGPERAAELLGPPVGAHRDARRSSSCSGSRPSAPPRCCAASRRRRSR